MLIFSRENNLGHVINEVLDCHRTMSGIYEQQSIADKLVSTTPIKFFSSSLTIPSDVSATA